MTQKRFEFADDGLTIYDNENDDHIGFDHDLEDLLNEQSGTIKKEKEDYLHVIRAWKELDDEHKEYKEKVNETLQKRYAQLDRITERYGDMHKPCKDLLAEICKELGVEIDD